MNITYSLQINTTKILILYYLRSNIQWHKYSFLHFFPRFIYVKREHKNGASVWINSLFM